MMATFIYTMFLRVFIVQQTYNVLNYNSGLVNI